MNHNTLGHQAAGIPQHSHNVKRCVKRLSAQKPHWRISNEEARRLFEMGVFNATTYLLAIVKSHGGAGWKWSFRVADFCKEYGFQRSTFYCALSKLRAKHLIFWSGAEKVTVWWQDIGLAPSNNASGNNSQEGNLSSNGSNVDGSKAVQDVGHSVQDVGHSVQDVGHSVQDVGQPSPETTQNQGVASSSRFSSDFSSTPPHNPPTHTPEEEEKIFLEKEEEVTQDGNIGDGERKQSPQPTQEQEEVVDLSQSPGGDKVDGGAAPCLKHSADDDAFLKWVEEVFLPTTNDYQAGKIKRLRPYALKVIANDGDVLRQDWLKSQQAATWAAYCRDIESKVRLRAKDWEAAGHLINFYYQVEDGLPAVAIDAHSHISGPDFLALPIERGEITELPPAAQSLLGLLRLRPNRQKKLNNFEDWARLGDFEIESYWIDLLLAAWEDSALRSQIARIIAAYPSLGLFVCGEVLVEDF